MKAASSRAMAVTTTLAFFPLAIIFWKRVVAGIRANIVFYRESEKTLVELDDEAESLRFEEIVKATLPTLVPLMAVLVFITFCPALVTWLPKLVM